MHGSLNRAVRWATKALWCIRSLGSKRPDDRCPGTSECPFQGLLTFLLWRSMSLENISKLKLSSLRAYETIWRETVALISPEKLLDAWACNDTCPNCKKILFGPTAFVQMWTTGVYAWSRKTSVAGSARAKCSTLWWVAVADIGCSFGYVLGQATAYVVKHFQVSPWACRMLLD